MFRNFLFLIFVIQYVHLKQFFFLDQKQSNLSLLADFTCAVAKNEFEKHPEMRTIAMIELENNFSSDFSAKVLKCLPDDVTKVNLIPPINLVQNLTLILPKSTLIIFLADKVEWKTHFEWSIYLRTSSPSIHHLSKILIVSSTRTEKPPKIFLSFLNLVQIHEENGKIIAKSLNFTRTNFIYWTFDSLQDEDLSEVLFYDKIKDLNGIQLAAFYYEAVDAQKVNGSNVPANKWVYFLEIVSKQLHATIRFERISASKKDEETKTNFLLRKFVREIIRKRLDFFLNFHLMKSALESYGYEDFCFAVPLPEEYSIADQILILPLDKSCWMWLGVTTAVSTLIWRISEGHWNFLFGAFAYFVGQSQLVVRIRTSRLTMKILLQVLIFTFFIFSNGYQSLVTSFMLNPMQRKLLGSYDELLDSELDIKYDLSLRRVSEDNEKYLQAVKNGRVKDQEVTRDSTNLAYLYPCRIMKRAIENYGDGESINGRYFIPEKIYSQPMGLYVNPLHPLLEKLQDIMDRTFEAGLHGFWEKLDNLMLEELATAYGIGRKQKAKEKVILDFDDIAPFFLILAFGFMSAILALFLEIFNHDVISELSGKYFRRRFKNPFKREIRRKKKRRRVRRTQVRPVKN